MADRPHPPQIPDPKPATLNPAFMKEDRVLLDHVAVFPQFQSLPELTRERLRDLSMAYGVDFATALLYDRVKRSPQHLAFINKIDQAQLPQVSKTARQTMRIAVVPAAFYKETPGSGADGRVILEAARGLGLRAELIPVSSTGTLEENSGFILNWLADHHRERIILISLCKGGADAKFALSLPHAENRFRNVTSWINICGTLNGSPVAEWLLGSRPGFFVAWLYCKCRGHDLSFIRELQFSPQSPVSRPLRLPAFIRLINIVGFPLERHLTNRFMRLCYQRVSSRGPTDGGLLLADLCSLPGVIYPVWGADHYLRPDTRARKIISAVLEHLAAADNTEAPYLNCKIPATGRTVQTTSE